ncbi:hypothetical protein [uncultured Sharpea sp.]|uniref:hypothetical protein n=1 Tax=uncultured Sharpea sp. TaxID=1112738 RepID=UPI002586CA9D|nr:hypothetical protein [uncultured Sharpea sp.]
MLAEKYDSAYQETLKLKNKFKSDKNKAHYYLLLTQTGFLSGHPLASDSLINISISYYEKNMDKEKLCDAYYYKAIYLINKKDYNHGIILSKKAYDLAQQSRNNGQQYKISEFISYINRVSGNYDLQLKYAKEAVYNALKTKRNRWIAYAYNDLNEAYQYKGEIDSAIIYAEKNVAYLDYIDTNDLPYILNNIGYAYMDAHPQKAKEFFERSIKQKPLTRTLENLAYIYEKEGYGEKAYELWNNALLCEDDISIDKIIYHILQYNLSHKNLDGACEKLYNIILINDSLKTALKDRTIQKLQQDYDTKLANDKYNMTIQRWVLLALTLSIIILALIGYVQYRKYKTRIRFKEHQLLINSYINEIGRLKGHNNNVEYQMGELKDRISGYLEEIRKLEESNCNSDKHAAELEEKIKDYTEKIEQLIETGNTTNQQIDSLNSIIRDYKEQIDRWKQEDNASKTEINSLKGKIDEYLRQINNLKTEHEEAERQIVDLNQKIMDLMEQESPRLAKGKLLYDQILQNGTTVEWTNDDSPKTAHNTFFLLLYEIGKNDKEIRQIMGITQEAIRSTRFRIQKHSSK